MTCRHCHEKPPHRRGLCFACYRTPAIRAMHQSLYPNRANKARGLWEVMEDNGKPEPTEAPCGSAEKIEVMAERLAKGLCLFHEEDSVEIQPKRPYPKPGKLKLYRDQVIAAYLAGLSQKEIAAIYGVRPSSVCEFLQRNGVKV